MKRLCFLYLLRGHQSGAGLNAEDALMKRLAFRGWLRSVKKLSSAQKKELRNELAQAERKSLEEEVAALVGIPARRLPHCHHGEIRPLGHASGLLRYRC